MIVGISLASQNRRFFDDFRNSTQARTVKPPKVKDQPLFIGGKWLDSVSGKTFPTINPSTGETICQVQLERWSFVLAHRPHTPHGLCNFSAR